jgi:serine/threonine protein kinase
LKVKINNPMARYIHHEKTKTMQGIKKKEIHRSREHGSMPLSYWKGAFSTVHANRTTVTKTLKVTDAHTYKHWQSEMDALQCCSSIAGVPHLISASADLPRAKFAIRMTRCPGKPLDFLYSYHPTMFHDDFAFDIIHQLLRILRDIHAINMIHYDVKIENMLYDSTTHTVSLVDLGFCRRGPLSSFQGTEAYAAPEIASSAPFPAGSHRSDIYSLGVCCYFILCMIHGTYSSHTRLQVDRLPEFATTPTLFFLTRMTEQMLRAELQRPDAKSLLPHFDAHLL